LNLFQRSVLALCRAGIVRVDEIAYRLALGEGLSAHVLSEVEGMGLVDSAGILTQRGIRLLDAEPDHEFESVAGYVFADPFDGALWPRYHRGALPYVEGELSGTWGTFISGSVGNPRERRARTIWPQRGSAGPTMPSQREILRTCSSAFRAEFAYKKSIGEADDIRSFESQSFKGVKQHLSQIVLVDTDPEPVFLTTFVFVPEDARTAVHWQVADPFGLGPSQYMRERVRRLVDDGTSTTLREVIESTTQAGFAVEDVDLLELLRSQEKTASAEVTRRIGISATDWPDVWSLLVQMEASRIEIGEQEDVSGRAWDIQQRNLKAMIRRAFESMEECLAGIARAYPNADIWLPLDGAMEDNSRLLANVARDFGFQDDAELPCFEDLLFTGAGPVKGVILYGSRELVASLAAVLLTGLRNPGHPIRRCASNLPGFIVFLNRLKRARDDSSHDSDSGLDRQLVLGLADELYNAIGQLLPVSTAAAGTTTKNERLTAMEDGASGQEWSANLVFRIRAQASRKVDAELGHQARELPSLRDACLELEHMALELSLLRQAGATAEEVSGRVTDFLYASGSSVEASTKCLLTTADVSSKISDDRDANAGLYLSAVRELGFSLDSDGRLSSDLLMVRPDRARAAAASRQGALNALLMAATLQAHGDDEHPLRDIAKTLPEYFLCAGAVSTARGHGDATKQLDEVAVARLRDSAMKIGAAVVEAVL